jgi:hypothetical protein
MARLTERQTAAMRRAAWAWLDGHPDAAKLPAAFFERQATRYDVASATARAAVHGDTWRYLRVPRPVPRGERVPRDRTTRSRAQHAR